MSRDFRKKQTGVLKKCEKKVVFFEKMLAKYLVWVYSVEKKIPRWGIYSKQKGRKEDIRWNNIT